MTEPDPDARMRNEEDGARLQRITDEDNLPAHPAGERNLARLERRRSTEVHHPEGVRNARREQRETQGGRC